MSKVYTAAESDLHKAKILSALKTVVNDLTGINPEHVDINANFMEVGIDSLMLIQATQLVKELYDVKLSVVQLLEQLTNLDALASYIARELPPESLPEISDSHENSVVISRAEAPPATTPAVTPVQPQQPPAPAAYTQPIQTFMQEVKPAAREFYPVRSMNGGPSSPLDQIMSQQLQLMARQLDMLHASYSTMFTPSQIEDQEKAAPVHAISELPSVTVTEPTPAPESNVRKPPVYTPYQPIEPGPTSGLTETQQRHLDHLIARFNSRTRESKRLTQEYRPYLSDSRNSFGFRLLWKELVYPIIADHSSGSKVWDVDSNEYVDVSMGFGVHLFGHSPGFVDAAMKDQIERKSIQLGPQVYLAGKVARLFSDLTGQERVNFCNSGTEAVMAAMRLARTVTQRSKIAIFGGAYHGWSDLTLAKNGSGKSEGRSVPIAPGISAKTVEDLVVLDWDSPTAIEYLKEHIHELAAVMVEPVQSRRPDIQPREFLHQLRELTASAGTALIFDEMITGFRIHVGGAQAWFGVQADISTYGKVIGGGLPIGVIAGKAAFLDAFDGGMWNYGDESYPQAIKTIFAGAFFKHPLTMAAAQAVLHHLRDNPSLLPELNERTARLVAKLNRIFADAELPVQIVHFASLFRFMFSPEMKFVDLFFYHMLDQGIYIWEGRNCFLSTAHSEDDLGRIVHAVERSIAEMRAGGFWPAPSGKQPTSEPSAEPLTTPAYVVDRSVKTPSARASTVVPKFSLYYFGNYQSAYSADKYELLFEGAKYADEHGFEAVWIPERHFHSFGGFSPNPSVVAAALARATQRVCIRAGSVVLPLHNPIRVAEEWSVVDNLSHGRVGISFASGWQPNDFVFAPEAYATRHEHMYRGIEMVQRLWSGEKVTARSGNGKEIKVALAPMPVQRTLPTWLTGVSPVTFTKAGELGTRILTNLQDQSIEELAEKIALYRAAFEANGHDPSKAHVTLLLHTFVSRDLAEARETARPPLYRYMRSSLALMSNRVRGSKSKPINLDEVASEDLDYILSSGYERYVQSASLIGTTESCVPVVDRVLDIGVNEIACMIDFGIDTRTVLESLRDLSTLRERYQNSTPQHDGAYAPAVVKAGPVSAGPLIDNVIEQPVAEKNGAVRSIPLTDAQRQLWIATQIGPDASRAYNESVTLRMRGPFDADAMRRALAQLIVRHELLRATFSADGECQIIHRSPPIDVPMVDFSHIESDAREAEAMAWITKEVGEPFDLERGPLVRFRMVKMDEQLHLLVFNNHHLVADGQSWAVLAKDLEELYSAARRGVAPQLPPPRRFDEYVARLHQLQKHSDAHSSEEYWLKLFQDGVPVLRLPTDRKRPSVQTYNGKRLLIATDASLFERVKRICAAQGSTLYMTLLAAYSALLHRLSGQQKIIVGVPAAGQLAVGCKNSVGYCVNLLPLVSDASRNPAFADYLATIKRNLMESLEHQHYSFGNLLERVDIPRDPSRSPLFTTVFNIDRVGPAVKFFDLEMEVTVNSTNWARYDLRMNLLESEDELLIDCTFNTDLFYECTIRRWMGYFQTLLHGICDDPERRVDDLPLMTETQLRQVLVTWNDTAIQQPTAEGFHRLFEAHADSSPEAVAVVVEDEHLSYRDLNARANRLARYLVGRGIGPEIPVALYLERSAEMIVALLAVMKAGGVYVPLDPMYPPERLSYTLADCGARVVLTHEQLRKAIEGCAAELICLDTHQPEWTRERGENLQDGAGPSNLAYLIYTSGSTGRPKGVAVEHRQLLNYIRGVSQSLSLPEGGKYATVSTLAADLGHTMIFPALSGGGTLHLITEDRLTDPDALADYFERHQIDCLKVVPSHLEALLMARHPEQVLPRRRLILGGEVAPPALLARLGKLGPECEVFNHYGPTEATVGVLTFHVPKTCLQANAAEAATLPLGHPIANMRVYVLDAYAQPVPPGIYGEVYIGGAGVARGYYNRPELTAERFLPDRFSGERGARLYRTGDVGRHLPTGNVEFLGRADRQVKLRGYRIEPGEIESALALCPGVRECVVVLCGDDPDDKRLVAYVVASGEPSPSIAELREHARRLPEYMQPSAFVILDELPLTPNGKVDYRRLPMPAWSRGTSGTRVAPRQGIESALVDIWSEVLKVEQVGTHDNFFHLGGHSLLATQVCSRVRKVFRIELPLRSLFETPTPAGLTKYVAAALRAGEAPDIPFVRIPRDGPLPLSFAQQRLWFIDRLEGGLSAFYNITIPLRLRGPLDIAALERTLKFLVRRHEVLRTRFVEVDGEPRQLIEDDVEIVLTREDLSALPEAEREAMVERLAAVESQRAFNIAVGPLLRMLLVRMGSDDFAVMLTMHHIISDGWSRGVLVREVVALYSDFARGGNGEGVLEELTVQYADFAVWQRNWMQGELLNGQLHYWRRQLAGAPRLLELPTDKPRPAVQTYRGATHERKLPKSLASSLKDLGRREGVTMFMTLLAAFQTLLYRYSGQEDIVVGSPIANRARAETEGLIGFFANTLVFRALFSGNPNFSDLLGRVRETALGAYAHQDVPFEMLIEELQPARSLSYSPLFQVMFAWNNAPRESIELPRLSVGPLRTGHTSAKFDLTLVTFETEQGITAVFEYNTDLFEEPTISRMARHFQNLVVAVATAPEQPVSTIVLLDGDEQRRLLEAGCGEPADYADTRCVHEQFQQQAERTPDAVALIYEEQQLTYRELDRRSDSLAARLQALGIGAECVVGLLAERSPEMVVGLLAVLKAGGAYLPLDPAAPPARLSFMLSDASVALVLLQGKFRACLQSMDQQRPSLEIEDESATASGEHESTTATAPLESGVGPDNLVYVMYTSGSTGRPKGVLITHRGVMNYLSWAAAAYRAVDGCGAPVQSPLVFDLTVTSLFPALLFGRPVHLLPEPAIDTLATALRCNSDFTLVKLTPSHLEALAYQLAPNEAGGRTRAIVIGGEALFGDTLRFWQRHAPTTRLINEYGPTETVVGCCVYEVPEGREISGRVPIGRPVANTQLYILDRALQLVPMGMRGELYVGGEGVGRGYLNRPSLTAERFVPHPFSAEPGMRLYRTGDIARYLPDGNIEYLGRTDDQVKVRGYRIELGEIEVALLSDPSVQECSVVSVNDSSGTEQLVAYVVVNKELPSLLHQSSLQRQFKQALINRLPAYMVPAVFVFLDELPRTFNGKVDRGALPASEHAFAAADDFVAPHNSLESQLAQIWEDLLNVRPVGINQSFFELGGHSMLAVRLMARIRQQLDHDLPISVLFQAETIEKLALLIEQQSGGAVRWSPLVPIQPRGSRLPFFCVHAVGGNVNTYYQLARELGPEQPFYGLQAPLLHEMQENETTIEQMAATYLEAITPVAGNGPYLLGGYSFGAYVAYEMARQLEAQGQRVGLLAIIDSYSPLLLNQLTHTHSVADLLISLAWVTARERGQQLLLSADDLRPLEFDDQLHFFLEKMREAGLAPPELDYDTLRRLVKGYAVRRTAAYTYTPPRYGGRITLFKCEEIDALAAQRMTSVGLNPRESALGWRELCDDVEVHTVPGHHDVICHEPYVQELAARIHDCLERAALNSWRRRSRKAE